MARDAMKNLACRREPKTIPTDERVTSGNLRECLREMGVPNPCDTLFEIQTQKEKRLESTCEWILREPKFSSWAASNTSQLLRLVGSPGIGKTMMATFIVETVRQKVEKASDKVFAYFFFDDKGIEDQRTPTAMLRSLIWQILLQNKRMFRHIEPDFDKHKKSRLLDDLFGKFSAMWRILQNILQDEHAGEIFILIDALDECDKATRKALLTGIHDLFELSPGSSGRFKILITCRPEIRDIEGELWGSGASLRIDSAQVENDLKDYINLKTDELAIRKRLPKQLTEKIRNTLTVDSGGTFLWVSLMVAELSRSNVLIHKIEEKLKHLPSGLHGIYISILDQIPTELQEVAQFILQSMVAARRPFTRIEIMTAFAASIQSADADSVISNEEVIYGYNDICLACSSIIIIQKAEDGYSETLNFCHQSVKDFLLSNSSNNHKWYYTTNDRANLVIFQACWKYLSAEDSKLARWATDLAGVKEILQKAEFESHDAKQSGHSLLPYGVNWWQDHAILSYPAVLQGLQVDIKKSPVLRDVWALGEAREGRSSVMRLLIDNGLDIDKSDVIDQSIFALATSHGHTDIVEMLLDTGQVDVNSRLAGWTPLALASSNGYTGIVAMLLAEHNIDHNPKSQHGWTPLSLAAANGHAEIVEMLLGTGHIDVDPKTQHG